MGDDPGSATDLTGAAPAVRTLTAGAVGGVVEELAAYHARFAPLFKRREQRDAAAVYLRGLLVAAVPRKNVEALALRLGGAGPDAERRVRALQPFVGEGAWDDAALLAAHQRMVDETLGEDDGVFVVDGSEVPKKGRHSVGVARQWCGATGKTDNCQAGVFLGYASRRGYTLLDRRLYLPERWFAADHRLLRERCRVPAGAAFRTKHQLAAELVEDVVGAGRVRGRWAVCAEGYGDDPALLDRLDALGLRYPAEVPRDTMAWPLAEPDGAARARPTTWVRPQRPSRKGPVPTTTRPHPASPPKVRLGAWAAALPAGAGRRYRVLEGSKGPLVADFVAVRAVAVRAKLPGPEVWVLLRRKVSASDDGPALKVYLSNAPADTPLAALVRVCGMRWPIESCFEEAKGELGLDHYELRSWTGWHRHMTLVLLAHHFLVRLQRRMSPREGADQAASAEPGRLPRPARAVGRAGAPDRRRPQPPRGAPAAGRAPAPARPGPARRARPARLPPPPQGRRLPRPPHAHAPTPG